MKNLYCPVGLAIGMYAPLKYNADKSALQSKYGTYPILDEVLDIRCPSNQEVQSYDEIVPEWGCSKISEQKNKNLALVMQINIENIAGKRVLLAGFGGGTEFRMLESLKPSEIYVVEYGNFICDFAKKYKATLDCKVRFYIGDICNLPFPDNYFDAVITSGIVHHTRTPELAHRSMWRVLKQGGELNYGHIYKVSLHNRRVSVDRERFGFHLMDVNKAKKLLKLYTIFYTFLVNTRLLKLINREWYRLPFLLELNGIPDKDYIYYRNNAFDYYLPKYRHIVYREDVLDWFEQCGVSATKTPKGFSGKK